MIMQRSIYLASLFFLFFLLPWANFISYYCLHCVRLGLREVAGIVIGKQLTLPILLSLTILLKEKRRKGIKPIYLGSSFFHKVRYRRILQKSSLLISETVSVE